MSDKCIVIEKDRLESKYIAEDECPRDGGTWPEYAQTMLISVDSFSDGLAKGNLHTYYFRNTNSFASLDQLLFAMDEAMEKAVTPEPDLELRREFSLPTKKAPIGQKEVKRKPVGQFIPAYTLANIFVKRGRLANFYVRVLCRKNASMQGILVWYETNTQMAFRSEMELIWLLRSALNIAEENK